MLITRIMPCLLLKNESLVKSIQFTNYKYIGDPTNTVRIFNEMEVDELIFLDISATTENRSPSFKILSEIASECFMPIAYGGGIRNTEDMKKIFSLGFEKVSINSYAVEHPSFITKASDLFGSQSIIVSIDVKKGKTGNYEVYTHNGKKSTGLNPITFARQMQEVGAGEILLTSIENDGMMEGYDTVLIKSVSSAINIPLIACGGAGKTGDFSDAVKAGASAVAAGSMVVYQGKNRGVLINFPSHKELKHVFDSNNIR